MKGHRLVMKPNGEARCVCGSWSMRPKFKALDTEQVRDAYLNHIASGCRR